MRTTPFLMSALAALLLSAGMATAHAAEGVFYDPSNAASPTGYTTDYELRRTIGCPGRGLMDTPCPAPAAPERVAAAPAPAPAPAPAYVAPPAPVPVAVAPTPTPAPAPRKLVLEGVNFDFDESVIRPEDQANIDKDVATLEQWGKVNIEVAGHTDSRGSDEYNMTLAAQRANAVRNLLIKKGIEAERLTAVGYGETQPVADNETDASRFKNRRVELIQK